MLGDNASDTELLRTLQVALRTYQAKLTAAITQKYSATVIAAITKQRDGIRMQIADVSARLKQADDPSSGLKRLEAGAEDLGKTLKFGGMGLLLIAGVAAVAYASMKAKGSQQW